MYDTHTHLNFNAFKKDYAQIIKNSLAKGMFLNLVGSQYKSSARAVEIAHEFKDDPVYATVGLHPSHLSVIPTKAGIYANSNPAHIWNYDKYRRLADDPKVVAIGETGLDYFRLTRFRTISKGSEPAKQHELFLEHARLAQELNKPLIIHCRPSPESFDAYDDLYDILSETVLPLPEGELEGVGASKGGLRGILHCFLSDFSHAQKFLDLGLYISFTGIITYKNAENYLIDTVKKTPLDRIMIETDCPYLTPEPLRGQGRNEPLYVRYIAERIAEIKEIDVEEVIKVTQKNGERLFLKN